ncbi:hypothetical protein EYF80_057712 [Liparis tanakae]|uniref:Uncharacterized protein n=1 Tax=Liparis tanakae TaxID=230148 RepID=A0A4Z2ETL4_9TELE|nr:hypothetical protein EYF80_057712 [Liparis tanakae]
MDLSPAGFWRESCISVAGSGSKHTEDMESGSGPLLLLANREREKERYDEEEMERSELSGENKCRMREGWRGGGVEAGLVSHSRPKASWEINGSNDLGGRSSTPAARRPLVTALCSPVTRAEKKTAELKSGPSGDLAPGGFSITPRFPLAGGSSSFSHKKLPPTNLSPLSDPSSGDASSALVSRGEGGGCGREGGRVGGGEGGGVLGVSGR